MAKKKTKAQLAYERLRKNVTQYIRRKGIDESLPYTPKQHKGKDAKITAKDYQNYAENLKNFYDEIKREFEIRSITGYTDIPSEADVVITNYLEKLDKKTVHEDVHAFIETKILQFINTIGSVQVANGLMAAQASGHPIIPDKYYLDSGERSLFVTNLVPFFKKAGATDKEIEKLRKYAEKT